jgi:outer membrane receptor for ferrienterochelin and colicins
VRFPLTVALVVLPVAARGDDAPPPPEAPAPADDEELTDEELLRGSEVIVVTETRSERPANSGTAAGEVVTRADLERTGGRTVADALQTRPGVWVERGFGRASVSLQNLGPEYTLVLVDGQRQIGRVDGMLDLDRITTTGVDRIEIVRGAGSALYGSDALGGVVNVITRDPDDQFVEGTARYDSLRAADLAARVGDGRKRIRWQVGGGAARGDGYDLDRSDLTTTASAFTEWRVDGLAAWAPGDGKRVALAAGYTRRDLRGVEATGTGAVFDRRNLDEDASVRLSARWALGDATTVRGWVGASEFRDQLLRDQRRSDALDDYQDSIDRAAEASAQIERRIGNRNLLTAGADGLAESLRSPRLVDGDGSRARAAVFVQDELRLGGRYQYLLVPAIRVDGDTQFGAHATPKLGARWDATDRLAVRASWGWGYRAPDFKQLYLRFENPGVGYVIDGDPDLAPETSQTFSAGVDVRAAGITASLDAYRTDVDDMIAFVLDEESTTPQRFVYANIASAHVMGVDVGASWQRGRVGVRVAYSLGVTRDEDLDRPLDGRPRHRGSIDVAWEDPGEGFTAVARVVATGRRSYFIGDADGDGMDDELVADRTALVGAQIGKRFARTARFYLGIDNLLDHGDATFNTFAPRTLYAGVEARQ